MYISPVNNYNLPTFRSVNRLVRTEDGRVYQTFTKFFRNDLNWQGFIEFLENKYKNVPRVSIYNLACSEGAEPCTLAVLFAEKGLDKYKILASDIDSKNIEIAQKGFVDVTNGELLRIDKMTNGQTMKYFSPAFSTTGEIKQIQPKPELKEKIEYKVSDILTEIRKAPKTNSVFLIRNVWPYLNIDEKSEILRELSNLDKTCCVVIGEIDNAIQINNALESYGFKKTPIMSLFEKEY